MEKKKTDSLPDLTRYGKGKVITLTLPEALLRRIQEYSRQNYNTKIQDSIRRILCEALIDEKNIE